jgi:hypothetical protein
MSEPVALSLEIPRWMLKALQPGDEIPIEAGDRKDLVRIDAIDRDTLEIQVTWLREMAPDEHVPVPARYRGASLS